LPWQIWTLLAALILTILAGIVYVLLPHESMRTVPLLGVMDEPPPTPLRLKK
jgi:hypothetical protein